jgi:hypothetical protein
MLNDIFPLVLISISSRSFEDVKPQHLKSAVLGELPPRLEEGGRDKEISACRLLAARALPLRCAASAVLTTCALAMSYA